MSEPVYESLFNRFVAAMIDNAVWFIGIFYVLGNVPVSVYEDHPEAAGLVVIGLLSLWFNYFAFSEWRWGQTLGKRVMGMRVTRVDGSKLSFGTAALRNVLRLVDWLVIGWVMIVSTKRHQRLGDKAAKTVVIRARSAGAGGGGGGDPEARTRPVREQGADVSARESASDAAPAPASAVSAKGGKKPTKRPEISWSVRDAVWATIGGLILAVIFAPLVVLPFDPDLDSLAGLLSAQALLDGTLIFVALGMASAWNLDSLRQAFKRLGLARFKPSMLGVTLATLFVYYVAAILFAALVLEPKQEDIGGELGCGISVIGSVAAYVLIAGLAPIAEEAFFRGFFFAGLRNRLPLVPAALISGLLFGSIHAPTGVTTVIPLSLLGAALAWLYERTGSLWPPIIAHAVNNGLALAISGC